MATPPVPRQSIGTLASLTAAVHISASPLSLAPWQRLPTLQPEAAVCIHSYCRTPLSTSPSFYLSLTTTVGSPHSHYSPLSTLQLTATGHHPASLVSDRTSQPAQQTALRSHGCPPASISQSVRLPLAAEHWHVTIRSASSPLAATAAAVAHNHVDQLNSRYSPMARLSSRRTHATIWSVRPALTATSGAPC